MHTDNTFLMTYDEIMELVKHMKTDTPEQIKERQEEAMRIIQEEYEKEMLKIDKSRELYIQERARTPKRQIYFGKVKTE